MQNYNFEDHNHHSQLLPVRFRYQSEPRHKNQSDGCHSLTVSRPTPTFCNRLTDKRTERQILSAAKFQLAMKCPEIHRFVFSGHESPELKRAKSKLIRQ